MSQTLVCPACKTLLAGPSPAPTTPLKCSSCNSRFVLRNGAPIDLLFKDYYASLGVKPDSSTGAIRKAFRERILQWHPDRNPDPQAKSKTIEILAARETLCDAAQRRLYDQAYFAREVPRAQDFAEQINEAKPQWRASHSSEPYSFERYSRARENVYRRAREGANESFEKIRADWEREQALRGKCAGYGAAFGAALGITTGILAGSIWLGLIALLFYAFAGGLAAGQISSWHKRLAKPVSSMANEWSVSGSTNEKETIEPISVDDRLEIAHGMGCLVGTLSGFIIAMLLKAPKTAVAFSMGFAFILYFIAPLLVLLLLMVLEGLKWVIQWVRTCSTRRLN